VGSSFEKANDSNKNEKNTSHFLDGNDFFISRLNHPSRVLISFALSNDADFINCLIEFF
jgi:hypothetical protein